MRNSGYYNGEGYYDPTAGAALENIEREERRNRKPRVYHTHSKPGETPGSKPQEQRGRCTAIHFFDKPSEPPKNKPMEEALKCSKP
jgi:hypothetical protein